jgi:pyruvate carboxylase subunit B
MKYIATVNGAEHVVTIEPSGEVALDGTSQTVQLEGVRRDSLFSLLVGTRSYEVFVEHCEYETSAEPCKGRYYVTVDGQRHEVQVEDQRFARRGRRESVQAEGAAETATTSPMPGVIVAVLVQEGQAVEAGEAVAILEAMKMENDIRAPCAGVIERVHVTPGQAVDMNDEIVRIAPPGAE